MRRLPAPDAEAARIAARQHGAISATQLRRAGLREAAVRRRVAAGRLHRVHRGVYAVGHPGLSRRGAWVAAVLACGRGAALSHRSAAQLWGILDWREGPVDVAIPGRGGRAARPGIRLHRPVALAPAEVTRRDGIPLTRPSRTLADLRVQGPRSLYRHALRRAELLGLPLGEAAVDCDHTRSELERRFLAICARGSLPHPEVNARVGRHTVDFLWRAQRLIVETDGYRYHRGSVAFEADRARDNELAARGYEVLRFTYAAVRDRRQATISLVRSRLLRAR